MMWLIAGISLIILGFAIVEEINREPKVEIKKCTNIKKFYKDNLLIDACYIACDEPITLTINPRLFTRIVEGENYIIEYRDGIFYSIVKEG